MDEWSNKVSIEKKSILRNYKLGKTLGIGSFAKVKLAEHIATGHKVAIKILNRVKIKNMEMTEKVDREIKILKLLMHPHVIRQYEVIETSDNIYVVMEYVKSGELFDYIAQKGKLPEDEARRFFQQILCGVEYCHHNMIVHRDLKPENILLDSRCNIKIADFGLSNVMCDGHFLKTSCGSPNYAAPEVISGKLYVGTQVDIWSCGVILYVLLCGTLPFDDENIPNLFRKIKGGMYTLPEHLSYEARDLIPRMLMVDPMMRISISNIRQHPWFNKDLPPYLLLPPPNHMKQAKKINEEIIQMVVKMGFDRNQVVKSILNRLQNEATVTYYLLFDKRNRAISGYLPYEHKEDISLDQWVPESVGDHKTRSISQVSTQSQRSWALGLQSNAQPGEIMKEICITLQYFNVCWKKIGHYNIKCRWLPGFGNGQDTNDESDITSAVVIKFEIQLYKRCEEKYLLDIQWINGPHFLFLDLCATFLTKLCVL